MFLAMILFPNHFDDLKNSWLILLLNSITQIYILIVLQLPFDGAFNLQPNQRFTFKIVLS